MSSHWGWFGAVSLQSSRHQPSIGTNSHIPPTVPVNLATAPLSAYTILAYLIRHCCWNNFLPSLAMGNGPLAMLQSSWKVVSLIHACVDTGWDMVEVTLMARWACCSRQEAVKSFWESGVAASLISNKPLSREKKIVVTSEMSIWMMWISAMTELLFWDFSSKP